MEQVRKRLSCAEANKMDLVDYLATIGHEAKSIRGNDYWFISPFREEHSASFKVNRSANIWYDHGEGKGGNLVDFGLLYYKCSVADLLAKLDGNRAVLDAAPKKAYQKPADDSGHIVITDERPLSNLALLQYSQSRGIPDEITRKFCREVSYTNGGKPYYAIGFKNDMGGFELRSKYFKGSSSPKGITHLNDGHPTLTVFEGFFNFLSFQTLQKNAAQQPTDFLILNSLSFFEKARPVMESYRETNLYLDNNAAGQKFSTYAATLSPVYKNQSDLYADYEDLNDQLLNKPREQTFSKPKKRGLRF